MGINQYGYFIDEYYYLASTDRLALGYIDHPPLSIWILSIIKNIFGNSLLAIRLPAIIAGSLVIVLSTRIAKHMGAGRFAQFFTGLLVLFAPLYCGVNKFYSMNSFDHLFWVVSILFIIRITRFHKTSDWIWLGVAFGFGLLNKHSVLFLGFAFFVALIISPQRKLLLQKGPWFCGLLTGVIFLPNLIWQIENNWATMEFMQNARMYKNYFKLNDFLSAQILEMNPVSMPVWLTGFLFLLVHKKGRKFQIAGWLYLILFLLFIITKAKSYYLSPIYPVLFAGGSVYIELKFSTARLVYFRSVFVIIIVLVGIALLPLSIPLLSPKTYIQYENFLGLKPPKMEKNQLGPMPQHFAGMFGWEKLGLAVWKVYQQLPQNIKKDTIILGENYGFSGAIEFYNTNSQLNIAGGTHNSYYKWGPPVPVSGVANQGKVVLAVGFSREELKIHYARVTDAGVIHCPYCMVYRQNMRIYLCEKPRIGFQKIWVKSRKFI